MFKRRLKEPFGKAGLTVAILVLVMAMVGGAWAAAGLNGKQKKEVKSIAKQFAGKPGATGPAGTAGTNGTNGKDGTNGSNGANGESVKMTESAGAIETHCNNNTPSVGKGGVKLEVGASKTYVCNGHEGLPWTAGGTLPSGSSEKGTWGTVLGEKFQFGLFSVGEIPISYSIPLAAALPEANIQVNPVGFPSGATTEEEEDCPGNEGEPKAMAGFLCLYIGEGVPKAKLVRSNSPAGIVLQWLSEEENAIIFGTWAVTAE